MKCFGSTKSKERMWWRTFFFFFLILVKSALWQPAAMEKTWPIMFALIGWFKRDIVMSSLTDWDELHAQSTAWEPLLTCFRHEALIRPRLYEGQAIYSPVIRGIQPENVRWRRIFLSLGVGFNFKMSFSSFWGALEEFSKPSGRHGLSNNAIFHLPIASLSQGFQRNPR